MEAGCASGPLEWRVLHHHFYRYFQEKSLHFLYKSPKALSPSHTKRSSRAVGIKLPLHSVDALWVNENNKAISSSSWRSQTGVL